MDRIVLDDLALDYERTGQGEPVVLVHATAFASWYDPLVARLPGFATLRYRRWLRRGAGGAYRPLSAAEDAAACARLMDHVGWPAAHVVGHSYGALVGLQMALDHPGRVASVALLEPAARGVSSSPQIAAALQPVIAAYRDGDTTTAVDAFLRHVCGDAYRAVLDRVVPGAFEQALDAADLFFQSEMPAVQQFAFGPDEARRVTRPVLNVQGADSAPRFAEGAALVQSWFPRAERLEVPDAGHLLMVQNPDALARGLAAFFTRHPVEVSAAHGA
jgi:pimeloyl-ACP methyl ester carboxylesterase